MANDIARISDNDVVEGFFKNQLEAQLKQMPEGNKLVILDTLSDIYLGDENTREKVNKFVKQFLGSLVIKYYLTILFLAHPSRTGQNTGDILSGSTAWENAVRNRLTLKPHKTKESILVLTRAKSNYAKRGQEIFLEWNSGCFKLAEEFIDEKEEGNKKIVEEVISIIQGNDKINLSGLSFKVKTHLDLSISKATIERSIQKLFADPIEKENIKYSYIEKKFSGESAKRWIIAEGISPFQSGDENNENSK